MTTPVWSVIFSVAREHGIPAMLGTQTATRDLRDGQLVTVDGGAGRVILDERGAP